MIRRARVKAMEAELVELRGLIQQTNAALAELRAELEALKKALGR
mgnify:CR=1 FL=1